MLSFEVVWRRVISFNQSRVRRFRVSHTVHYTPPQFFEFLHRGKPPSRFATARSLGIFWERSTQQVNWLNKRGRTWAILTASMVMSYLFVMVQHLLLLASVHLVVNCLLTQPLAIHSVCFCSARWIVAGLLLRISSLSYEPCWRALSLVRMPIHRLDRAPERGKASRYGLKIFQEIPN